MVLPADAQKKKGKKGAVTEAQRIEFSNLFMKGQKNKMIENQKEALDYFEKALKVIPSNAAAKYEIARIYFDQQRVDDCQSLMLEAVKADAGNEWYSSLLAQTYTAQNKMTEALKIYQDIIKKHPDKTDYLFEIANINLYLRNYKEALETFNEIENNYGVNEDIVREKLNLYDQMGKTDEAVKMLEDLSEKQPQNPFYSGMLSEYYHRSGDVEKGKDRFYQILKDDPGNGMAHLALYEYHLNEENRTEAIGHLKQAMASDELNIDMKMNILLNYYSITELDRSLMPEALELVDILIDKHPNEAKSHAINGDFLMQQGKIIEAREEFLKAVELSPDKGAIWSQILAIDFELREFSQMVEHTNECLELYPTNPEFYYFNGLALNRTGEYEEAISILNSGKELVFDNTILKTDFLTLLGESYNYHKDFKNSDKAFEKALTLQADNALILNNYSYYLSLRGERLERAEEMIKQALAIAPGNPSYLDTYAWVLFKTGNYEEAKTQIELAMAKGGGNSGAVLEHYGDILFKLGDEAKAVEQWKIAQTLGDTSDALSKKLKDKKYYE
ncbi:MAG: tetratricopeptide repeat protein [Flavobacteriales bacterium]|nr:tetratricopeptide repeat protein [Flavobacteriales bacterium]